jgi:hypothetical protein
MSQSYEFLKLDTDGLVAGLVKHEDLLPIDPHHFHRILMENDFEGNGRFLYYPINSPINKIQKLSDNAFLSIDGLILNRSAKDASEGRLPHCKEQYETEIEFEEKKNLWDRLIHKNCTVKEPYPTYEMMEDLIHNVKIIELMMAPPEAPFTLLGRFYSYESNSLDDKATVFTRPVLVKPGIDPDFDHIIYKWERANVKFVKGRDVADRLQ